MITDEEIKRAFDLGVVIIPFKAYSAYNNEGNLSEENYIGVKYVAHRYGNDTVLTPDHFYLEFINEYLADISLVGDTPTEALDKFEEWYKQHYATGTWVA